MLLLAGCVGLNWRQAVAPIVPPQAASFAPEQVALGARLIAGRARETRLPGEHCTV